MRFLNVLCIDGVVGVGKTTQVLLFSNLLKSHNIPFKILSFTEVDDIEITKKELLKIEQFLLEQPDGIVICDGSIATDIVEDIALNMGKNSLYEKHGKNLQIYKDINIKLNFINILLTPLNLNICQDRLIKKANMTKQPVQELSNRQHLQTVVDGLANFDNNMITYDISFHNICLNGIENIKDIHDSILAIIQKNNLRIKKPSNEG